MSWMALRWSPNGNRDRFSQLLVGAYFRWETDDLDMVRVKTEPTACANLRPGSQTTFCSFISGRDAEALCIGLKVESQMTGGFASTDTPTDDAPWAHLTSREHQILDICGLLGVSAEEEVEGRIKELINLVQGVALDGHGGAKALVSKIKELR